MWDPQLPALAGFRVVRYDHPGHGSSPVSGSRTVEELAGELLGLLDALEIERASVCGLSLGGAVAMRLALDAPERLDRLVLLCTSARFPSPEAYAERAELVRREGLEAVADAVLARWFTRDFPDVRRYREMILSTSREGYARCCEAVAAWDVREELHAVSAPTLVVAGAEDPGASPEHAAAIAERIPGARMEVVEGAAHLASVERADAVNRLLLEHL